MRFALAAALLAPSVAGFTLTSRSSWGSHQSTLFSSTATETATTADIAVVPTEPAAVVEIESTAPVTVTAVAIKARLDSMLEKLQQKDATSRHLSKEVS
jgi:hypothetical protein